ncbi:MAG: hypothetical protein ACFBSD_05525 [Paracoccaceae bacterium]
MRWGWVLFATLVLYFAAEAVVSSYTLSDLALRPLEAVSREGERVVLWVPDGPGAIQPPGTARFVGGEGVILGHRLAIRMPSGDVMRCTHRLRWMTCADGWQPVRRES